MRRLAASGSPSRSRAFCQPLAPLLLACFLPVSTARADTTISSDLLISNDVLTVSGPGILTIEGDPTPTLTLSDTATTSGVQAVILGGTHSGNLFITTGSTLTNSGSGTVGNYAGVDLVAGRAYLGLLAGSTGTATVTGQGSTWTNSSLFYVGYSGTGSLNILDGALASNTFGYLGRFSGSVGTATVSGQASTWTNNNQLHVGDSGTGHLTILDGGLVSNTSGSVGRFSGSIGTATVSGTGAPGPTANRSTSAV